MCPAWHGVQAFFGRGACTITDSEQPLTPQECAERARLAAPLIDPGRLHRSGSGEAEPRCCGEDPPAWRPPAYPWRTTSYPVSTSSFEATALSPTLASA